MKSQYKCKECDFICGQKSSFYRHIAKVHEQKKQSNLYFNCNTCGNGYTSKQGLEDHILLDHERKIPLQCAKCEFNCNNKKQMTTHIESVHEGRILAYECFICNAKFSRSANLKLHVSSAHEVKNPHKCTLCEDSFSLEQYLVAHIGIVHENKKAYNCYLCNFKFLDKIELNGHIATAHEG